MSKTTNILLGSILLVSLVSLIITLTGSGVIKNPLGSAEFNRISDGVTHSVISVSITATGTTEVLAVNNGAVYRRLQNTGNYRASCQLDDATSTLAAGTGIILYSSSSVNSIYEMTPENLYWGKIRCISEIGTTTISIVEK